MLAKHVVRVWRIEAAFSLLCLSNKMDISMMLNTGTRETLTPLTT
jgi:hypothetical protein